MEKDSFVPYQVLYIGGNFSAIDSFQKEPSLFSLTIVENGLTAINFLKANPQLDAILSEYHLPGMNAIEIFKLLRLQNIHPKTPYIILTDDSSKNIKDEAFALRVNDYYDGNINPTNVHVRIGFLKLYAEYFSVNRAIDKPQREYRIPWNKRLFDIAVSFFALLMLSPVFIIVMIAIRLESKGKVYYTSKRVGTGYRIFDFYKLRSMFVGADAALQNLKHLNQYDSEIVPETLQSEPCPRCAALANDETCSPVLFMEGQKICEYWYNETKKKKASATFIKIKDDPRVTRVGKFIRNTSIDELPQLLNVFKGDMSIVGNRPLPLYEAELLTSDDWSERFMGPAGITGLWQVEKRGKKGAMSEEERKALDNQYAKTYSFWGDITIILRTIPALFQKENV